MFVYLYSIMTNITQRTDRGLEFTFTTASSLIIVLSVPDVKTRSKIRSLEMFNVKGLSNLLIEKVKQYWSGKYDAND